MAIYNVHVEGFIYLENIGYYMNVYVVTDCKKNIFNKAKKIAYNEMKCKYNYHTNDFFINHLEKVGSELDSSNPCFFNL